MALYVLDTGVLVGYIRAAPFADFVERRYQPAQPPNSAVVPEVVVAELRSLALQRGWQGVKISKLDELVRNFAIVPISHPSVIDRFAELDAYRLGKHPRRPLPVATPARSIGDNDLWIAAVASVLNATLLTTDYDFDVFDGVFLKRIYIDQSARP